MPRYIILVGDRTSDGGVVITGSPTDHVHGRAIARQGDLVDCPRHGVNAIVEGDDVTRLDGRPMALEGHRTECGCTLIGGGHGTVV
ncbi:hypothetical protein RD110_00275 [Rhodoferax koreense]|uniref:PAAR domain-containing protein n=1 Tax=Rhodoferax koreensis TaxID=1842727 RepID=A0A1P8JQ43_9BURK|nr:PAAR domain-containing protein [Rhodoferax koreense]APW35842.1 hypothetical protein RD110_00275 [Rhodoferax koreense]